MAEAAEALPEGVSVTLLTPEAVLGLRGPVTEHLERAIAKDAEPIETPQDVIEQAMASKTQVWLVHEGNAILGVVTTVILQHPAFKVIRMIYLAGDDIDRWEDAMLEAVAELGRRQQCQALEFGAVRRGWTKRAKAQGFRQISVLYRRALEE